MARCVGALADLHKEAPMPSVTRPSDTSLRVSGIVFCLLWMSTHVRRVSVHTHTHLFNTFKLYLFTLCVQNVCGSQKINKEEFAFSFHSVGTRD